MKEFMIDGGRDRLEMQDGTRRVRAHRRGDKIVRHLRRCADDYDFVFEEGAIGIIGVPKFWIEYFVEREWRIRLVGAETKLMRQKILGDIGGVPDFRQDAGGH